MTKIENNTEFRLTAREVLVIVAGPAHAEHAVVKKLPPERAMIAIECSCGARFKVAATEVNRRGLRNVVEVKSW